MESVLMLHTPDSFRVLFLLIILNTWLILLGTISITRIQKILTTYFTKGLTGFWHAESVDMRTQNQKQMSCEKGIIWNGMMRSSGWKEQIKIHTIKRKDRCLKKLQSKQKNLYARSPLCRWFLCGPWLNKNETERSFLAFPPPHFLSIWCRVFDPVFLCLTPDTHRHTQPPCWCPSKTPP